MSLIFMVAEQVEAIFDLFLTEGQVLIGSKVTSQLRALLSTQISMARVLRI